MSVLCDKSIRERIESKSIVVEPFLPKMVQPASIDLRLGTDFLTYLPGATEPVIQPVGMSADNSINYERVIVDKSRPFFYLYPDQFVLGTTYETVEIPDDLLGRLEGKSSLGRIGLLIHITAGYIDPGFKGQITLELLNVTNRPIKLVPGMPIGQLSFETLDQPCEHPYGSEVLGSHYQGQVGATAADFTKKDKK